MRKYLSLLLLIWLPAWAVAVDPAQVMQEVRDRDQGQDRRSDIRLVQTMPDGFVRERVLVMYEKSTGPNESPPSISPPPAIQPVPAFLC